MPQAISLTEKATVEIIAAYTATNQAFPAVAAAPGWYVVGSFFMPKASPARLECEGLVSAVANVLTMRLVDVLTGIPVGGSTTEGISAMVDTRKLSGSFELAGGKTYQMQAQIIGPSGFGVVRAASLV